MARTIDQLEASLTTPSAIDVDVVCPSCELTVTITAELKARMTRDSDGTGHLALRVRSAKAAHVCGQPQLGLVEGPRER